MSENYSKNFTYFITDDNGNVEEQSFVFDPTIPYNTAKWDTILNSNGHTDHIIYYNLNKYQKISSINVDTFNQIYKKYFKKSYFSTIPDLNNNNIPNWISYNPEEKMFYLRFDYVFNLIEDYSSIPVCSHYTSPITSVVSEEYHYANKPSFTHICSHPTIVANNNTLNPTICHYVHDRKSFSICPLYSFSSIYYKSVLLKSINSDSILNIAAEANVTHSATKVSAKIFEVLTDQIIHEIELDFIPDSKDSIINEFDQLFTTVISAYDSTHVITESSIEVEENQNVSPVTISKKSYISSLV
jgi:hypothetical protein